MVTNTRMDTLYFGTRDLNSYYTLELGLEGKVEEPRKKITTKVLPRYLPIFNKVSFSIQSFWAWAPQGN